jgi:polyisoprenoid-binding protein YceI
MATWVIDNVHSTVEFSVKHMMVATVKGRFTNVSGTIEFDENNPLSGSVEATVDVASINTQDANRDNHLRSPDFFDVERFPTITFKSKRIEPGNSAGEYRIVGDLTIHGVTREVVLNATYEGTIKDPYGNLRAGFSAQTTINRKDFDLNWNVALEAGGWLVSDRVNINLEIEAIQKAAVPASA